MTDGQELIQQTALRQHITQQHLRYVKLLEMNAPEVDDAVRKEMEENPALVAEDEAEDDHKVPAVIRGETFYGVPGSMGGGEPKEFTAVDNSSSLYDYLNEQLAEKNISGELREVAAYIIHSLNPDGYLERDIRGLREDLLFNHDISVSQGVLEEALEVVRSLDPAGVGAADLRDALLLQLHRMPESQVRDDALKIIEKKFEAFTKKHTHKLISALRSGPERVEEALRLIRSLNPLPGNSFNSGTEDSTNIIIPDFVVEEDEETGQLTVSLNNKIPGLAISESFRNAYRDLTDKRKKKNNKLEKKYVSVHYKEANDFINIFRHRQQTMFSVMTAIVSIQFPFFESGDVYLLRPMLIKDIAAQTGLDISTVSRTTKNKFVATPWGTYPLRFFFSDSLGSEENGPTNRMIEAEIKKIVDSEDKKHPLSDEKIKIEMEKRGFPISRRTVTKYRERCGIPVSRLRK